jgi:hypothetical protein
MPRPKQEEESLLIVHPNTPVAEGVFSVMGILAPHNIDLNDLPEATILTTAYTGEIFPNT